MEHPITPPPELVQWLRKQAPHGIRDAGVTRELCLIAVQASQWGWDQRGAANEAELQQRADQELEACCEWVSNELSPDIVDMLRAARRPKPPSLKEQALEELDELLAAVKQLGIFNPPKNIRRALEQLND